MFLVSNLHLVSSIEPSLKCLYLCIGLIDNNKKQCFYFFQIRSHVDVKPCDFHLSTSFKGDFPTAQFVLYKINVFISVQFDCTTFDMSEKI